MKGNLIDIGYDKDGKIILVMYGTLENKPFQTVIKLDSSQACKLSEDLKMTVDQMERGKNVRDGTDVN
jgi:hypothetical protein